MQSNKSNKAVGVNKASTASNKAASTTNKKSASGTQVQILKGVTGKEIGLSYLPGDLATIFDATLLKKLIDGKYAKKV